jgi:uncharacterized RDD family membrane protein YckC
MSFMPESVSEASQPVTATSTGNEDVLGLRISAALVDLAVLFVLSIVLSVVTGEATIEDGNVSFYLNNAGLGLFLALVILYYFAPEAAFGRTLGKLLLGVRVVDRDGSRPSVWAVAVRTALRVVDWLPVLYLAGFVAMMRSGVRRQRLGDFAAKTSVVRAAPLQHRGPAAVLLAAVLLVAVAVSVGAIAVPDAEDNTYRAHGVSFQYPAGWQELTDAITEVEEGTGEKLWTAVFGVDVVDIVTVTAYRLTRSITAENLDAAKAEVTTLVRGAFEQTGGAMQDGPEEITMGGIPGLRYRGEETVDGTPIESTLVFVFDGTTEYFINCQHSQEHAAEIARGCDLILRTFKVEGRSVGEIASYESYTQIADDSGVVSVEVPVEWDDVDGREDPEFGPSVHAAPDLERFRDTWDVPGVMVDLSSRYGPEDIDSLLNQLAPSDQCTSEGREAYENPPYTGEIERWTGCGGTDTTTVVAAVAPADDSFLVRIFGQAVEDRDLAAIDRALDTVEISTLSAATDEDWLEEITRLRTEIDDEFWSFGSELTSPVMTEMATVLRSCSRELASIGAPSARMQQVHALVNKACRQYDKGADCFDTAARIGIPLAGSAEDRRQTKAIDCGFDAANRGTQLFVDAENEAEILQSPPG